MKLCSINVVDKCSFLPSIHPKIFPKFVLMKRTSLSYAIFVFSALLLLLSCGEETETPPVETPEPEVVVEPDMRYGYDFNQYEAKQLKIKRGDTFGAILERNGIDYPEVYTILQAIKGKVSVRKLQIGKPYTLLLFSKDSVPHPKGVHLSPRCFGLQCHSTARQHLREAGQ